MKNLFRAFFLSAVVVAAGLLTGCQVPKAQALQQAAAIGYGVEPAKETYEPAIRGFMKYTLKDPDSAQYDFHKPYSGFISKPPLAGGGIDKVGWFVPVNVNAKNSYGGYVGFTPYKFLFRDNKMIAYSTREGIWTDIQ